MLETIREFALERLDGSRATKDASVGVTPGIFSRSRSLTWMTFERSRAGRQRHEVAIAEQENFRAAIDWAVEDDVASSRRELRSRSKASGWRSDQFEAVRRFGALLERAEGLPHGLHAGCWRCLAASSTILSGGRREDCIDLYEKSLDLYRRAGDKRGVAIILNRLGTKSACSATWNAGAR